LFEWVEPEIEKCVEEKYREMSKHFKKLAKKKI
jgi:hypothetical protein